MKRLTYIITGILILVAVLSCTKRTTPSSAGLKKGKLYDSATFEYLYVEAIKQKLLGNSGDALKYLEQCLKLKPNSDGVYYEMAQIVMTNGDAQNGKKYMLKAFSADHGNIWYLMTLASIYYQERNLDSAIVFYEEAVKYYPERESIQLALGNLYSENRQYDKAAGIFNAIDKKYGINNASTLSAVKNSILAGRYNDALQKVLLLLKEKPDEILYNGLLAEIYRGQGEKDKAAEIYSKLIKENPDNPETLLSLCDFLLSEKNYEEVLMLLNTVTLNTGITREDKIRLFARLTEDQDLIKSNGEKLQVKFMVLEEQYNNDDVIMLLLPDLMIKMGENAEAAARLEEITDNRPENYYAWEKLLMLYLQERDYKKLESKGKECATRFNMSFLAKMLYANGAMENGNYDTALEEIKKAAIIAGENKELRLQVLSTKASVYYRMKDYQDTFSTFEEALKLDNTDLTILNNYAYYLAEQNMKLKEAEKMAAKVIEKEKNNVTFLDTYVWVLYKRGKTKEAARIMESIMRPGNINDAELLEHYGYILKKQRNCTGAVDYWKKAFTADNTKTYLLREIENCGK